MQATKTGVWRQRHLALCLVVLCLVVCASCDREDAARKDAESQILAATQVPSGFVLVSAWEAGNGGGGPVAAYRVPHGEGLSSVRPPVGFSPFKPIARIGPFPEFVPSLNASLDYTIVARSTGQSPDGTWSCDLSVAKSSDDRAQLLFMPGCHPV